MCDHSQLHILIFNAESWICKSCDYKMNLKHYARIDEENKYNDHSIVVI